MSTLAAYLFSHLKQQQQSVELVTETVKQWAYEGRPPQSFDQIYLFASQLKQEDTFLRNGVDLIVTDSPLLQCAIYGEMYSAPGLFGMSELIQDAEAIYPSLNIVLTYEGISYNQHGRYQTIEAAIDVYHHTLDWLKRFDYPYLLTSARKREGVVAYITSHLDLTETIPS